MMHELLSDDRLTDWLQEAEGADPWQAANLREMQRMVSRARAVPADLAHHFAETASACSMMWVNAKQQSDYTLVLPLFEKMLPLLREKLDAEAAALDVSQNRHAGVEAILDGQRNVMIGTMNGKIVYVPFAKAIKHDKGIDRGALELVKILSI
jgi:Zn-dependent M32 family carboxypeptidase